MNKLICADLYKAFHRTYFFLIVAGMSALALLFNSIFAGVHAPLEASLEMAGGLFLYPLFLPPMFADVVTAEENKEHTLKNTLSFGTSRTVLYLSKTASTILITLAAAAVTLAVYFASAFLLLAPKGSDVVPVLSAFALRIGVALLLYIAGASLATLLAILVKRNALFSFAYFGAVVLPPLLFRMLSVLSPVFRTAQKVTLLMQSDGLASFSDAQLLSAVWIALIHFAVFTALGAILFRRQEVG